MSYTSIPLFTQLISFVRFRWVVCQLDSLGGCFDLVHLRQALASLPKTLDDTYARIFCNIDNHYNHYSRQILKILQWLSFSSWPLHLKEVAEIVAIDVGETPRFDPQRRMGEPRDILTMCSSLITLTGVQTYVRLAHFSVKEYLVSDRVQRGTASFYSLREIESHGVLAEDCIAYLLQFDEPGSLTSVTLGQSPLAHYAARSWMRHAKLAEQGSIKSTTLLGMELFMAQGEAFLNWIRIQESRIDEQLYDLGTPLYYASGAGLFELARRLIEGGMDVNAQGSYYGNALQFASYLGELKVVQLLVDNKADVNAQGGRFGNALVAASYSGEIEVVQLLIENKADVDAQGGHFGNALYAASCKGNIDIVSLLLDNGADVNSLGDRFWESALYVASKSGYENMVQMLLEKGADVNALSSSGKSALHLVSRWGYEDVVKILLEGGADVNALSKSGKSALFIASDNGHENMVKMLEAKGAVVVMPKGESSEEESPETESSENEGSEKESPEKESSEEGSSEKDGSDVEQEGYAPKIIFKRRITRRK